MITATSRDGVVWILVFNESLLLVDSEYKLSFTVTDIKLVMDLKNYA